MILSSALSEGLSRMETFFCIGSYHNQVIVIPTIVIPTKEGVDKGATKQPLPVWKKFKKTKGNKKIIIDLNGLSY